MRPTLPAVQSPAVLLAIGTEAPPPVDFEPLPAPASALERAQNLCTLGRFGAAVTAAGEAITVQPRDAAAWCVMAEAQLGQDRPAAALQAARAAGRVDPTDDYPHRLASLALEALGRETEAADAAAAATAAAPDSWQAQARLAHCLAGFPDRLDEAWAAAERARDLEPFQAGPYLAIGRVAMAAGEPTAATSAYCAALGVDPQCAEAHSRLSELEHGDGARRGRRAARVRLRLPGRRG